MQSESLNDMIGVKGCGCMYASIVTDQIDADLETALRIAKLYGYTHVELQQVFEKGIEQCSMKEISHIRSLLTKYDRKVSCLATTLFLLCPLHEDDVLSIPKPYPYALQGKLDVHLKYLRNACRIAKRLNCTRIRIFPFRYPDNRKPPYGTLEDIALLMKAMRKAVTIAEEEHITLVLENSPYTYLPKGYMSIQVVKGIRSEHFKLLWDGGNSYMAQKDYVPQEYLTFSILDELHYVYPWVAHIHIRDCVFASEDDATYHDVAFAQGDVDYMMLFSYLRKVAYPHAVSLNADICEDETLESMKTLQDWLTLSQLLDDKPQDDA